MRKMWIYAMVAAGTVAGVGLPVAWMLPARAQEHGEHGRTEADKALRDYYGPTAQFQITGETEINGVKVFDALVTRDGAHAEATVTSHGHYITTGLPQQLGVIAAGAQETAGVFRVPPQTVTQEEVHGFWITVSGQNHRMCNLQLDAAGRIRNITASEQLHEDAPTADLKVDGPIEHQMRKLAEKRFSGIRVEGVVRARHDPGYYQIAFRSDHGQGWAIMNPENDVTEWRVAVDRKELPEAVHTAMERDLHGDRILSVQRGSERVYRFVQNIGGEEMVMLVKPDGAVEWLSSRALHVHHH